MVLKHSRYWSEAYLPAAPRARPGQTAPTSVWRTAWTSTPGCQTCTACPPGTWRPPQWSLAPTGGTAWCTSWAVAQHRDMLRKEGIRTQNFTWVYRKHCRTFGNLIILYIYKSIRSWKWFRCCCAKKEHSIASKCESILWEVIPIKITENREWHWFVSLNMRACGYNSHLTCRLQMSTPSEPTSAPYFCHLMKQREASQLLLHNSLSWKELA